MKTTYRLTTQKEVRAEFWKTFDGSRNKVKNYESNGKMYTTNTSCAFVDFVDSLARNGEISEALANRVTLD